MPYSQRYRITEKIDAGGMAEVYRGIAESAVGGIKKAVAIKRILPSLTKNKKFVSMFLDEANLKTILESLRRQGKKLPMAQVIWIMMQVCNALSYAHDATDPETGRE